MRQGTAGPDLPNSPNIPGHIQYDDFARDSFAWLVSEHDDARDLVFDVVDTRRVLRCADALRQRGAALKTSGGYSITLDSLTANGVCILRGARGMSLSVQLKRTVSGESNIANCELTRDGDLRASFLQEQFPSDQVTRHAAHNAALALDDIYLDAIESFTRAAGTSFSPDESLKSSGEMRMVLEGAAESAGFRRLVKEELGTINPAASCRISIESTPCRGSNRARVHFLNPANLAWDVNMGRRFVGQFAAV